MDAFNPLPSVRWLVVRIYRESARQPSVAQQSVDQEYKSHYAAFEICPGCFQSVSHVNAHHRTFNHVGRDRYINYNNFMNDGMVVRRSSHHVNRNIIEFRA